MFTSNAITSTSHSAQAAQILAFQAPSLERSVLEPFENNLDHLKALEQEASLLLAVTYMRRNRTSAQKNDDDDDSYFPAFPMIKADAGIEEAQNILNRVAAENRIREELTLKKGIPLNLIAFCTEWNLDQFERSVVTLLLMQYLAPDFISLFGDCEFERGRGNGMEIGTLLSLLCSDLGKQLECRRYFSVVATLMKNDIITITGSIDDTTNILDEKVHLLERYVRFILGDNNLYNSCFRYIKREKSSVKLEQVILADHIKDEIIQSIESYLSGRNNGSIVELDDFFGYGTALTLLFHGASGTGKTMLARAIAARFDCQIFSLTADDMREMPGSYEEILGTLFREAALLGAIVFLDECDDLFENSGRASRALLIEIEKAHCVVIMATNKPVDLDPALERRITMKVHFTVPEAELRLEMWQSLIPATVKLADDVSLAEFAERYQFTGGLIRNSIFLALTFAASTSGQTVLTADLLHRASEMQTATLADEQSICHTYTPSAELDTMPLQPRQRSELKNISNVWKSLHERQTGLAIILGATDIATAIQAADGIAKECGLKVRSFDYQKVISLSDGDRIIDPVTQRKILPLDYAFSPAACDAAITLFIDYEGVMDSMIDGAKERMGDILMRELLVRVRKNKGLFCMVTKSASRFCLPTEFNLMINLEHPSDELQLEHWQAVLGEVTEEYKQALCQIVAEYPMHLSEIDYITRQAGILATIRRLDCSPNLDELTEIIAGYRKKQRVPLLFGGGMAL